MRARILIKSQQKAGLVIGLLLFLFSINVQGALSRPVTEDGKPTEVHVVGAVLDIDKINSAEQNFTLNFYAIFRWLDPRLAHAGPGSDIRSLSDVWNPRLTIINTQRYWENTRDEVEVSPEGLVTYRLHVFGDFSQHWLCMIFRRTGMCSRCPWLPQDIDPMKLP